MGDNLDEMLLTVNGQVVRTPGRPNYKFNEIEDILWNYHIEFQKYFNKIINMIIPEDYIGNQVTLKEYINVLLELIQFQAKKD